MSVERVLARWSVCSTCPRRTQVAKKGWDGVLEVFDKCGLDAADGCLHPWMDEDGRRVGESCERYAEMSVMELNDGR